MFSVCLSSYFCGCVVDLDTGSATADIFGDEGRQMRENPSTCSLTDRIQVVGQFYGMAGDLKLVNYTWPRPVVVSALYYARCWSVLDPRQCAIERGARLDGYIPGAVAERRHWKFGTLYSKF